MSLQAWSWVLTAVGMTGFILAGKKLQISWAVVLLAQILWCVYAFSTKQYGFVLSATAYTILHARNARGWKHELEQHDTGRSIRRL